MAVCTHCGRESRGDERFCMSCGQPLTSSDAAPAGSAGVGAGAPVWPVTAQDAAQQAAPAANQSQQVQQSQQPQQSQGGAAVAIASRSRLIVRRLPSADGGTADGPGVEVGEFILDGRDVAIGRAPSCDIVLEGDQLASRRHALLRSRSDGYTVVDLGSSNGTYINDLEIREAVLLHEGDRISIGGHELIYSTSPASPHASLAGVKLADPEAAPMSETDPNAVAVIAETAESPAVVAAAAAPAQAESLPDDDAAFLVTPADLAASAANDEAVALDDAAPIAEVVAVEEAQEVPADESSDASATAATAEPDFAASGLTDADFEALRQQLAQVSDALARKASAESRVIGRLRGALESARDQLAALAENAGTAADSAPSGDVSNLIMIARQAAENPRHLDYLTALAEHAGEIADALEAGQSASNTSGGVSASDLDAVRARLDEALG